MRVLFTIGLLLLFCFGFKGCGEKPNPNDPLANFKPNKAELGEDWEKFKHDASFNVWVFKGDRPREHRTAKQARVFYDGVVTSEELNLIDEGLTTMLAACRQDTNRWGQAAPPNVWTKFPYFQNVSDYKIILVPSNYTLQEGEAKGCAGMVTGAGGAYTTAGTVGGMIDKFNSTMPASQGGIYLIIPKQSAEQLANPQCKNLMKNAVRHEGEHVWLSNSTNLYFSFANDTDPATTGGHPYCRGMSQ